MSRPLRILILGRDPDMFASPGGAPNDTRERHIAYVRELQRRRPGSEVRIIVHTWRPGGGTFDAPIEAILEVGGTHAVGIKMFSEYLLQFEIVGVFLLGAVIGAIVLAKTPKPANKERKA